jgi:DNA-directed RNA polymerase specialized sigma24 family protein
MKHVRSAELTTARYIETRPLIASAVRYAKATYARHVDVDELIDEAHNAFLRVDRAYDSSRGASFNTLLRLAMRRSLSSLSQRRARQLKHRREHAQMLRLTDEIAACVPDLSFGRPSVAAVVEDLRGSVSNDAFRLAHAVLVQDYSKREAARMLGLPTSSTRRLLLEVAHVVFGGVQGMGELKEAARRLHLMHD